MKDSLWITWIQQTRNRSLTASLGVPLYVVEYKGNRIIRYLFCIMQTIAILLRERPKVVFAQNPSIVLNFLLLLLRPFYRYKFISDAHFSGIEAFNENKLLQFALDVNNRFADAVIVTNDHHARHVEKLGGKAFICEDPLPDISRYQESSQEDKVVFFICSYDVDEPYKVAFDAAKILESEGYKFYVTGNYNKADISPYDYSHIRFLGYVSYSEYYACLYKSQIVVDLTQNENCLVCGAYEAMAAEKPLVTSNKKALKRYFYKGTVFTDHDVHSIASSIRSAYNNKDLLRKLIKEWKYEMASDNNGKVQKIIDFIQRAK